jgi:hypothetical protein
VTGNGSGPSDRFIQKLANLKRQKEIHMTNLRRYVAGALIGALAVLFILAADKAHAQSACGPADQMVAAITGPKYHEAPLFDAIVKTPVGPKPIRMFANPSTGTWTLMTMQDNGMACLAGSGQGFKLPRKQGSDA